jgi:hypothetical protein
MPDQTEKYLVRARLQHDGTTFQPGDQIELQEANAAYLLRQRKISKIETAVKKGGKDGEA